MKTLDYNVTFCDRWSAMTRSCHTLHKVSVLPDVTIYSTQSRDLIRCSRLFQAIPQKRATISLAAYTELPDQTHHAHCSFLRLLHYTTNPYRLCFLGRMDLLRDHRILHNTAPQRRKPILTFCFLDSWAICDDPFSAT